MVDEKFVRLAGIAHESLVNGPGIRRVIYAQGCKHNCLACFNKATHSFQSGELKEMDELVEDIKVNPILNGVTFSGGDPLEQADKFAYLAMKIKAVGLSIWCYTGYTFEYILQEQHNRNGWKELLKYVDVIVDGPFQEEKQNPRIKFRGSSNQRIIDVQLSLRNGSLNILKYDI